MFKAIAERFNHWRIWLIAGLITAIVVQAFALNNRGHRLDLNDISFKALNVELTDLREENARLAVSARAVSVAAQAQSLVCQSELTRRARIEEITDCRPAAKPEEAVDANVSKKAVDLLNHDLFAPLGHGLRRPAE